METVEVRPRFQEPDAPPPMVVTPVPTRGIYDFLYENWIGLAVILCVMVLVCFGLWWFKTDTPVPPAAPAGGQPPTPPPVQTPPPTPQPSAAELLEELNRKEAEREAEEQNSPNLKQVSDKDISDLLTPVSY